MLLAARAWCLPLSSPPVNVPASTNSRLSMSSPGTFSLCCFAIHTFSFSPRDGLASNEVMAGQSRRRSRESIFSPTKDAVRSLSRAGSQQGCSNSFQIGPHSLHKGAAIRLEDGDQSHSEISPGPHAPQICHFGGPPTISLTGHLAPSHSNVLTNATKQRMLRPMSWIHTPQSRKNRVGRSISVPVLTSTTNANVARVEGVWCGELAQADLVQSIRSSQAGWTLDHSCYAEHVEAGRAAEVANETKGSMVNGMDRMKSQVKKRRDATLLKLKGAFRGHLGSMCVSRRPLIVDKIQYSKLEEECIPSTARRKAEGISLCKQKIKNLTGHRNAKRKPIEKDHQFSARNIGERRYDERPLLMSSSMSSLPLDETKEHPNLSDDYTPGDLEMSFINAVDKPDFQQTLQRTPDSMASTNRQSLLAGVHQRDTNNGNARLPTAANKAGIHTSSPEQCAFSVSQAGLVPTPTNKRRPRVNPLGCHPNVMGMAEQLVDTSEVSTPPMDMSTRRIEATEEEVEELENAPIYSPSSGNLSQYAKPTPSPARSTASAFHTAPFGPGNLHEIPYYTPTRPLGRSGAADYAAHQRRRGMMARHSNLQLFSDFEQAPPKEIRSNATLVDEASKSKTKGTTAAGGNATDTGSPNMQQKPQASGMDGWWPAREADRGMETLELSPYRVGNSKRVIGWAPLPSSPGYRYAPSGRTTYGYSSNENLRSTD